MTLQAVDFQVLLLPPSVLRKVPDCGRALPEIVARADRPWSRGTPRCSTGTLSRRRKSEAFLLVREAIGRCARVVWPEYRPTPRRTAPRASRPCHERWPHPYGIVGEGIFGEAPVHAVSFTNTGDPLARSTHVWRWPPAFPGVRDARAASAGDRPCRRHRFSARQGRRGPLRRSGSQRLRR